MSIWNHSTLCLPPEFSRLEAFMLSLPERFCRGEGVLIHDGRNKLRRISHDGEEYVVKSFRRPNVLNRLVYGVIRKSKALRSYRNACLLESIGVGTPKPVGYLNIRRGLLFEQSYFVTLASRCRHRYEDLFTRHFDCRDEVLKAIARTTAALHEHRLAHKDYGRANILFGQEADGNVRIELVDLNRMSRGQLGMKAGCKNFERLPATPQMHRVLADEYARLRGFDPEECFRLMEAYRSTQPGKIDGLY